MIGGGIAFNVKLTLFSPRQFRMKPKQINYSAAYSFADSAVCAVQDPSCVAPGDIIADFFGFKDDDFFDQIEKPQKYTILHTFIYNINSFPIRHYLGKIDGYIIIDEHGPLLDGANIPRPWWFNEHDISYHIDELREILEDATKIVTEAAFQLLYADRTFLFEFNKFLHKFILTLHPDDHPSISSPGVVKRTNFPAWLKNAVFHRDKGRCQLCGCDLTNILVPTTDRHIDHMVPLRAGGTNDPTNFQLTCGSCNTSKGARIYATNHLSYSWW